MPSCLLHFTFVCLQSRDRQLLVFLVFAALLSVVGAIGTLGGMAHDPLKMLWGFTTNAILLVSVPGLGVLFCGVEKEQRCSPCQKPLTAQQLKLLPIMLPGVWQVRCSAVPLPLGMAACAGCLRHEQSAGRPTGCEFTRQTL